LPLYSIYSQREKETNRPSHDYTHRGQETAGALNACGIKKLDVGTSIPEAFNPELWQGDQILFLRTIRQLDGKDSVPDLLDDDVSGRERCLLSVMALE
jgi:hypothetical protein